MSTALAPALRDLAPVLGDLAQAIAIEATCADEEFCGALTLSLTQFTSEPIESLTCVSGIRAVAVPGELCRIDFNIDKFNGVGGLPLKPVLVLLIRLAALPLLERFGHVIIDETEKGAIVRRCEPGKKESRHDSIPEGDGASEFTCPFCHHSWMIPPATFQAIVHELRAWDRRFDGEKTIAIAIVDLLKGGMIAKRRASLTKTL